MTLRSSATQSAYRAPRHPERAKYAKSAEFAKFAMTPAHRNGTSLAGRIPRRKARVDVNLHLFDATDDKLAAPARPRVRARAAPQPRPTLAVAPRHLRTAWALFTFRINEHHA